MPIEGLAYNLQLAKLSGMNDLAPVGEIASTQFKPVPTA